MEGGGPRVTLNGLAKKLNPFGQAGGGKEADRHGREERKDGRTDGLCRGGGRRSSGIRVHQVGSRYGQIPALEFG